MAKNKKFILTAIFSIVFAVGLSAQVITTASAYFKTISDYYASFKDYEATIEITADKKEMAGKVSYKRPNLLRIDFANPENQVIVFNGDMLTIYLPSQFDLLAAEDNDGGVEAEVDEYQSWPSNSEIGEMLAN